VGDEAGKKGKGLEHCAKELELYFVHDENTEALSAGGQ
jgi:hypothetical protein